MKRLSVVYMGGKQAGCIGLLALHAADCDVLAVVAYDEQIANLVEVLGLPLFGSIQDASLHEFLGQADLLVCVHGREIVPKKLLNIPKYGGINVHPCLYAYKGPNPVERLLRDQNPQASVGVHRMTEQLDEGEVLVEEFVQVPGKRSVEEVYNLLYPSYAIALLKALRLMCQGK